MRVFRDEHGQTTVYFAAFVGLIALGFLAIAIDVGTLIRAKRMAQSAADAAAFAASEELAAGYTSNEQTVANAVSKLNGFDPTAATNPATVTLSTPSSGNFTGSSYVQATVSMPVKTLFLGAFVRARSTMPVAASAIAGGAQTSQTCVCLTGTTGQTLNLSNASKLLAPSCGVVDNSSGSNALGIIGGALLNGLTLGTVSTTWNNSSNINNGGSISSSTTIVQGITTKCSPSLPAPPTYSSCANDPGGSYGTFTWGPANSTSVICYKALTIGANGASVTLNPGIYVITTGALHFESGANGHSNLGGNGVFFYLTGTASLIIDNGANVNLVAGNQTVSGGGKAPTVGPYDGILFYQDTSDTAAVSVQGGSFTYINGAMYAPSANMTMGNGSSTTVEGAIAANSLTMNGGGTLTAVADANEGSLVMSYPKIKQ